jgi:hypothetical protein
MEQVALRKIAERPAAWLKQEISMSTLTRRYDGDLAVATLVLNLLLAATQIGFVADGLMMISEQGWFLSLLFAIVIASGLLFSQFALSRLWERSLNGHYAWCLGIFNASIIGLMSVWGMTQLSEPYTYRWYFGVFLGVLVPLQTTFLARISTEMFNLAGSHKEWFPGSYTAKILTLARLRSDQKRESLEAVKLPTVAQPEPISEVALVKDEPTPVLVSEVEPEVKPQANRADAVILNSETALASISFTRERVSVLIKSDLSKRQWKELHSKLRRVPGVIFEEVQKSLSDDGKPERSLSGRVIYPESKGNKNRQKRDSARLRHLESLLSQIKSLIAGHR